MSLKNFLILLGLISILALSGCIQQSSSACGNGICESGEEDFCARDCKFGENVFDSDKPVLKRTLILDLQDEKNNSLKGVKVNLSFLCREHLIADSELESRYPSEKWKNDLPLEFLSDYGKTFAPEPVSTTEGQVTVNYSSDCKDIHIFADAEGYENTVKGALIYPEGRISINMFSFMLLE